MDLTEESSGEVEERIADGLGVVEVLEQLQQCVQRLGKRRTATQRGLEEVETIALHADAEEVGDVLRVQRLLEDVVDDAENTFGHVRIVRLCASRLLVLINAGVYRVTAEDSLVPIMART